MLTQLVGECRIANGTGDKRTDKKVSFKNYLTNQQNEFLCKSGNWPNRQESIEKIRKILKHVLLLLLYFKAAFIVAFTVYWSWNIALNLVLQETNGYAYILWNVKFISHLIGNYKSIIITVLNSKHKLKLIFLVRCNFKFSKLMFQSFHLFWASIHVWKIFDEHKKLKNFLR